MNSESALYYYRARTYDPKVGRFLQTDPVPPRWQEINRYVYVANRPLNHTDPYGLTFDDCMSSCVSAAITGCWELAAACSAVCVTCFPGSPSCAACALCTGIAAGTIMACAASCAGQ